MPTIQTNGFSREELLRAAAQLNAAELEKFVDGAIELRARMRDKSLSVRESELLLKINRGISAKAQRRFDELVDKRRGETLTEAEHQELLRLTNRIEKADARRIELIAELARLKGQTFDEVIKDLGIGLAK